MQKSSLAKKMFLGAVSFGLAVAGFSLIGAPNASAARFPALDSPATNSNTSFNWAGYEATNGKYTSVSGTWTVPTVTATSSATQADATWVGIGGVTSRDLIQGGTQEIVNGGGSSAGNNNVQYIAWYETLPQASQPIPVTIHPGDSVTVSLTETVQGSGIWNFSFRNNTTGQNYQTSINYSSSESSAEWIEEMPTDVNTLVPLDAFGSIPFTNTSAVKNGSSVNLSNAGARSLTMVSSKGQTIASPSGIGTDGSSFTVTRSSAVSSASGVAIGTSSRRSWRRTGVGIQGFTSPRTSRVTNNGNGTVTIQFMGWGFPTIRF